MVKARDDSNAEEVTKTYEELVAEFGKLPSGFMAIAPILVPILLMALASIVTMAKSSGFVVF